MVGLLKRMRNLKELFAIRFGPGAAILPKDVKRIHMDFAVKISDGHYGARKFWRHSLPRLKYHNPAVSMTINRTTDQAGPATMSVFFAPPPDSTSPTASPAATQSTSSHHTTSGHEAFERVEAINIKHMPESEILRELLEVTKAVRVEPTAEEKAEMEILEEQRKRSEIDRQRMDAQNRKIKREKAFLAVARDGVEAQRAAAAL